MLYCLFRVRERGGGEKKKSNVRGEKRKEVTGKNK